MLARVIRRTTAISTVTGLLAAASMACSSTPTSPSDYAPFSETDLTVGTGAPVANGNLISVDYTGWLYDPSQPDDKGAVFATSTGSSPIQFTLGAGDVITGWDQGIVGMNVGGVRRLVIPPSLAYGGTRKGVAPPYATLIYDVTLDSIDSTTTSRTSR